ncbi:hypothetical protein BB562_01365 [Lactiplantibacillus pentosus]|nr:hypothetical protein BB562_01365 [Lactiplantibacillus pentosus]
MLGSQIILSRKWASSDLELDSYLKLRSGLLREFKSASAYVPAIVSRPRKSDHSTHRLTNSNPNRRDLIMAHDKYNAYNIEVLTQKSPSIIASIPLIPSYQPTQKKRHNQLQ